MNKSKQEFNSLFFKTKLPHFGAHDFIKIVSQNSTNSLDNSSTLNEL